MNTEIYYMHIIILGILTVVLGIGVPFLGILYAKSITEKYKGSYLILLLCIVDFCLFAGGLYWWIISANEPLREEFSSYHEIKDVIFPDGSKVQMFTCDDRHHNMTELFSKIIDEKEWNVRRVRWSTIYKNVSWSGSSGQYSGDHFFLEHKKKEQQPIEIIKIKD